MPKLSNLKLDSTGTDKKAKKYKKLGLLQTMWLLLRSHFNHASREQRRCVILLISTSIERVVRSCNNNLRKRLKCLSGCFRSDQVPNGLSRVIRNITKCADLKAGKFARVTVKAIDCAVELFYRSYFRDCAFAILSILSAQLVSSNSSISPLLSSIITMSGFFSVTKISGGTVPPSGSWKPGTSAKMRLSEWDLFSLICFTRWSKIELYLRSNLFWSKATAQPVKTWNIVSFWGILGVVSVNDEKLI